MRGGDLMAVSYKKLFHLMIEKDMTNTQLMKAAGLSANIMTRMKRGGYLSLESIEGICKAVDCGVDDILEFVPEENKSNDLEESNLKPPSVELLREQSRTTT